MNVLNLLYDWLKESRASSSIYLKTSLADLALDEPHILPIWVDFIMDAPNAKISKFSIEFGQEVEH